MAGHIDDYDIRETVGNGSFGEVKVARHKLTGVKVAIKVQKLDKPIKGVNVREEIKILKLLTHPCIVRLYDVIETPSQMYIIMEFCDSGDLFDYVMTKKSRLQENEARKLFQQIIFGVEYCHANMVVHRDLKLENIMLDAHHQVKLIDFGFGHIMEDDQPICFPGGSLQYTAPEVLCGKPYDGPKVDIWSCGVILYALLCRQFPFNDGDDHITSLTIQAGKYSLPSYLSLDAKDLIQRILVVDPKMRITIPQIRQHRWFQPHLPSFLAVPPLHRTQQMAVAKAHAEEIARKYKLAEINTHSSISCKSLSRIAQLDGHTKVVTGITLPSGCDKLISGCTDGSIRAWNCHTGECIATCDMGSEVGCLKSEGCCVFVGVKSAIKVWNMENNVELAISAPGGQVYAITLDYAGRLLAGNHDGSILVWRFISGTSVEAIKSLKGHTGPVISLVIGGGKLYSGSTENTIKQWDLENMICIQTLRKHSGVVTSLIWWEDHLISCSLDQTLKVWYLNRSDLLEDVYTHKEEHSILALCHMIDGEGKPILLCSCGDNSVRLYELPSFMERGRINVDQAVTRIVVGPRGLFFTGGETGRLSVWRLPTAIPESYSEMFG